ncbi:hypothetical protein DVS28_b0093 (plasmid) [Euzebya pacifica]|uniref:Uncharacterized protein n=1 Tax=Euzebya pacifica TaxID=1608957 RepID=A0A346Y5W6_9ACTN|nr:hypothetical protein [Euzebya pacifica]AXV09863.1 hypothetical protein DVS28_b0093 [Euzebya pacifica]
MSAPAAGSGDPVIGYAQEGIEAGLRLALRGTVALVVLFTVVAAVGSGPWAAPLVLLAAAWALTAGIAAHASSRPSTFLTGPAAALAGVGAAGLVAWTAGLPHPSFVGLSAGVVAANAFAATFHPALRSRVDPPRTGPGRPPALAMRRLPAGSLTHLAVTPAGDRWAHRMVGLAASPFTPGHPALCGDPHATARGACRSCVETVVELAGGQVFAGGRTVTWNPEDPLVGLIAVTAAADPDQEDQ